MASSRLPFLVSAVLLALGVTTLAGWPAFLVPYTYPIAWWGLLPLVDEWNFRRSGRSLWRSDGRRLVLVLIPASVLYWLMFEVLNLAAPQWRYRGSDLGIGGQVLYGFVAFATVIPIVVEAWWLVLGDVRLPEPIVRFARRHTLSFIGVAALMLAMPLVNDIFWFNQGIWIAPALILLPFLPIPPGGDGSRFLPGIFGAGLLSGFVWEALNWKAVTHWEYLILPNAPHLFQMPLPGYIGFVPFALATAIVYCALPRLRATWTLGAALYAAALGLLWLMTTIYYARGLWVSG